MSIRTAIVLHVPTQSSCVSPFLYAFLLPGWLSKKSMTWHTLSLYDALTRVSIEPRSSTAFRAHTLPFLILFAGDAAASAFASLNILHVDDFVFFSFSFVSFCLFSFFLLVPFVVVVVVVVVVVLLLLVALRDTPLRSQWQRSQSRPIRLQSPTFEDSVSSSSRVKNRGRPGSTTMSMTSSRSFHVHVVAQRCRGRFASSSQECVKQKRHRPHSSRWFVLRGRALQNDERSLVLVVSGRRRTPTPRSPSAPSSPFLFLY